MKNVADIWPLAPLQELMLAHALADPNSRLLNEQLNCTIRGTLDGSTFKQAWETTVARHAMLRACFAWQGLKKPMQVIRRAVELPWREFDWRDLDEEEMAGRRTELLTGSRDESFDLTRAPLVRLDLARLGEQEWLFAWTCHHLALDGWCLGVVLREVFECYANLRAGRATLLSPPGNFADYLKWLARQDSVVADKHWCGELENLSSKSLLPPADQVNRGSTIVGHGECEKRLGQSESARLAQLATTWRTSLSALVESAWGILLARHSRSQDVSFGVAVSGRAPQVSQVETIVGPFANNVPRRVTISHDDAVATVCQRLQQKQIETQPLEHCSLEQIGRAAGRSDGRLFDSLVVFENYPLPPGEAFTFDEITIRNLHGTTTSSYPLTLIAMPGRELVLRLLYDRQLYSDDFAARMLDQVMVLLKSIAARPETTVRELPLVEQEELELLACLDEQGPVLRVLDGARQLASVGMPGDLWVSIAGKGTSPTQDQIVDPLDSRGLRMLRPVGYRAVRVADGELEFLGPVRSRASFQKKDEANAGQGSVIQVGRYAVDPLEVAAILTLCPLVRDAAVIGYTDRKGHEQLAAYVVPRSDSSVAVAANGNALVTEELRRFLAARVPDEMIPRAWRTVHELPYDERGRLDTSALPPAFAQRSEGTHPYVAPRDVWEERVASIWSQVLGVEPIGVTDNFLDLGGHSSLAVALVARLDEQFGRRLPLAALLEEPTVEHLARLLREAPAGGANALVVPLRPAGTGTPLFCVHPAGGTVFCYLELAQHVDQDVPLYGIQAQGIDGAVAPHDSIEAMAADYIQAMKAVQPHGPYQVCGWSTGGVVAFEIARQLTEQQDQVAFVGLIDAAIPSADRALDENDLVPMLQLMFPTEDADRLQALRDLPIEKQVEYFQQRAQGARLLLAGAGARGARAVYDVFEANMKAVVAYQPGLLRAPLVLIRAEQHATPMHADPRLGWGPWGLGGIETFDMHGSHLTMLQSPAVEELAAILSDCLSAATVRHAAAEIYCSAT
ncbi:MAG TPA: condensation domain-containing protein [Pirellulales bacterium]